jgi:hypothetical protein
MQEEKRTNQHESDLRADLREQPNANLDAPPKVENVITAPNADTSQEANALVKFASSPGTFAEYPKTSAVWQFYEKGIRDGERILLFSVVHGIESDLRETKDELNSLRKLYHEECLKTARLEGQLSAERKLKILQSLFIIIGGLLNTLAIKLYYDQQKPVGVILFILGLGMIFAGLLWPKGGNSKK